MLASDGMLLKRPILVENGTVKQIGYRKAYEELGLKQFLLISLIDKIYNLPVSKYDKLVGR